MKKWSLIFLLWVSIPSTTKIGAAILFPKEITLPTLVVEEKKVLELSGTQKTKKYIKNTKNNKEWKTVLNTGNIIFYNSVNKNLHFSLVKALSEYSGPSFIVSSGLRKSDCKSNHYIGKAVDIHFDESAEDFVEWTETENGKAWMTDNNLQFFIEDRNHKGKDKLKESFKRYFRRISWASGLHIHLEVK